MKLDNSDPYVASELPPWHRGWICSARAGVGLRNGGWKGPRGHIERFGGKMACLLKYVIVEKWVLLSPRMPEHAYVPCSVRACHPDYATPPPLPAGEMP